MIPFRDYHLSRFSVDQYTRAYEAAPPKPSKWRDERLRILVRLYGTGSIALADTWFVEQRGPDVVLSRTDGSRLVDKRRRIEAANGSRGEARAIIELALMKDWSSINFTGTDDFKRVAMAKAFAAGIPVHARGAHDMALLAQAREDFVRGGNAGLRIDPPV
ncbi:LPD7 domain-containing protein [Noviherbaspirillum malthae]|uniref:LPD7 domain-containing protein n=1 Tax=Noviherbaspirillum malthae TaxID=1260987 RepID=UPI00188E2889|nr:LPD7 domain-containing protein [Noviherbaspirillum malthae]